MRFLKKKVILKHLGVFEVSFLISSNSKVQNGFVQQPKNKIYFGVC